MAILLGRISVADYGAKGDFSHNDTSAIQSALRSALPGQTIYFPPGHYSVNGIIEVPEGVSWILEGESSDTVLIEGSFQFLITGMADATQVRNYHVKGISFRLSSSVNAFDVGVKTFLGLRTKNNPSNVLFPIHFLIENCSFYKGPCIDYSHDTDFDAVKITVRNCYVKSSFGGALDLQFLQNEIIVLDGCTFVGKKPGEPNGPWKRMISVNKAGNVEINACRFQYDNAGMDFNECGIVVISNCHEDHYIVISGGDLNAIPAVWQFSRSTVNIQGHRIRNVTVTGTGAWAHFFADFRSRISMQNVSAITNISVGGTVKSAVIVYADRGRDLLQIGGLTVSNGGYTPYLSGDTERPVIYLDEIEYGVLGHHRSFSGMPYTYNVNSDGTLQTVLNTHDYDSFNRVDSPSTLGATSQQSVAWIAVTGTWGINTNKAYSITDTSLDLAVLPGLSTLNYAVTCSMYGVIDMTGSYRMPQLVIKYIDSNNYFYVQLTIHGCNLCKREAGVDAMAALNQYSELPILTSGQLYQVKVVCRYGWIWIYRDGIFQCRYHLSDAEATTFAGGYQVGLRLERSGTPASLARWDDFIIETF